MAIHSLKPNKSHPNEIHAYGVWFTSHATSKDRLLIHLTDCGCVFLCKAMSVRFSTRTFSWTGNHCRQLDGGDSRNIKYTRTAIYRISLRCHISSHNELMLLKRVFFFVLVKMLPCNSIWACYEQTSSQSWCESNDKAKLRRNKNRISKKAISEL